MKWPQIAIIVLFAINAYVLIDNWIEKKQNPFAGLIATAIIFWLLIAGGFFK